MLYTNLKHIENAAEFNQTIGSYAHIVIVCGRMEPMCVPVYRVAEELDGEYKNVQFFDLEYDNPEFVDIINLPIIKSFNALPILLFYKNGNVIHVDSGNQTKSYFKTMLNEKIFQNSKQSEFQYNK
jgi:thioredoxin 1